MGLRGYQVSILVGISFHTRQRLMFPMDHELVQLDMATGRSKGRGGDDIALNHKLLGMIQIFFVVIFLKDCIILEPMLGKPEA